MKVDRVKLRDDIDVIANENLEIISDRSLGHFVNRVRDKINNAIEDYFNEIYLSERDKIKNDTQCALRFTNLISGYKASMSQWTERNTINIESYIPPSYSNKNTIKYTGSTVGIGIGTTLVLVFGGYTTAGVTIALISVVTACTYTMYKKGNKKDIKNYEHELFRAKNRYLDGVKDAMDSWLDEAEKFSEAVLANLKEK